MCFVPMYLSPHNGAIRKAYPHNPLTLLPMSRPIDLLEPFEFTYLLANGDGLNI